MIYYLYKKMGDGANNTDSDIKINSFCPKPWRAALPEERIGLKTYLVRVNFWLCSRGKARIYYVCSPQGKPIHTTYLIPKCSKFDFMSKRDLEIGPCMTDQEFRGRGIYPKVLDFVTRSAGDRDTTFYMIVAEDNATSIKGIEKAGFERCGEVVKTRVFKRYRRVKGESHE